ncbi:MAG: hypothetical protein IH983_05100 [Planctomycetes bacterium]|nr:hypothetical protein [Planctomycetota bacterium]
MATKVLLVSYRAGSAPGMGIGLGIAVALVAVLAIVLFGPPQEDVAIVSDGDDVSDHPAEFVKGQIASLEASIAKEIPSFRLRLEEQAGNVRRQVDAASSESQRRLLRDELAEIARTIIALEDHEREVERILAQLKSTERRLARLRDAKSYLGPEDEKLREELATIANDLNLELSSALDERIGSGAITDARVDAKLAELLAEDKE